MNDWREFIFWWLASLIAGATIVGGKLGMFLFRISSDPPDDVKAAAHWLRRRRWLAYSELSALPAFATIGVSIVAYYKIDPILSVLISMFLGGVGFVLLLDGVQWLFRKRLGMPTGENAGQPPKAQGG
ncbi:MAG: hypothetical protein IT552_03975 [Sphingomonadaceae bacterium]|nr:hypothetical protein [Sphingomonadaceae bacterium]